MQIHCIVKPQGKTDSITVNADGSLRIKIKADPVNGKANNYLVKFLANVFAIDARQIQIISGFTGSHKRINIVADESYITNMIQNLKNLNS